jgi:hypothetical protein
MRDLACAVLLEDRVHELVPGAARFSELEESCPTTARLVHLVDSLGTCERGECGFELRALPQPPQQRLGVQLAAGHAAEDVRNRGAELGKGGAHPQHPRFVDEVGRLVPDALRDRRNRRLHVAGDTRRHFRFGCSREPPGRPVELGRSSVEARRRLASAAD